MKKLFGLMTLAGMLAGGTVAFARDHDDDHWRHREHERGGYNYQYGAPAYDYYGYQPYGYGYQGYGYQPYGYYGGPSYGYYGYQPYDRHAEHEYHERMEHMRHERHEMREHGYRGNGW